MVYYDAKNLITVILFLEALMKLLLRLFKVVYSLSFLNGDELICGK